MNAPWKGGASGRDPFSAFVCDDNTFDVARSVCETMGWAPEKVSRGGLRNAIQSLSVSASPNILLVDLSESGDPLNDINALAEVCEPGTMVIAIGQINDVRLYRDLMLSGLHDYLLKPFGPDALRDSIAQAQAMMNTPKADEAGGTQSHVSTASGRGSERCTPTDGATRDINLLRLGCSALLAVANWSGKGLTVF